MSEAAEAAVKGDLRALVRISVPLMLFLFFESVTSFCERVFLSYYSVESVHSSLSANYLSVIFQSPLVAIAMMAQVFVGLYYGSGSFHKIGPCIWQLIWFSFFSFFVTVPFSFPFSSWYFRGASIESSATEYFMIMAWGNFLYPLHMALASFYFGRGKTLFVTGVMLGSYLLSLLLSPLLIFGVGGWIPSCGAQGGALAKCASLGVACFVLFIGFLKKENRTLYHTAAWQFSPGVLWNCMQPGLVRALGYFSSKICWAACCYVMIQKGGRYLDVLTIGGTVVSFLVFTAGGVYKAVLIIAANLIGAGRIRDLWKLCRVFILYEGGMMALLAVPILVFPNSMVYFFDAPLQQTFREVFPSMNYSLWVYLLFLTLQMSFCALLITLKEFRFQLYCYLFLLPLSAYAVYFGIGLQGWEPEKLWWMMAFESAAILVFFWMRFRQILQGREQSIPT